MTSGGRVQQELKEIERDKASGVTATLKGNSLQSLVGFVPGPKDTPYDGGVFMVDIQLDDQYPFVPPKMKFVTRVWHPNISSQTGGSCSHAAVGQQLCAHIQFWSNHEISDPVHTRV